MQFKVKHIQFLEITMRYQNFKRKISIKLIYIFAVAFYAGAEPKF